MKQGTNVLFDLDGTLTDSRVGILACIRHALITLNGVCPDDEQMQTYIGPPLTESFGSLLGEDPLRVARAIALYRERFTATGMFENAVYPDIPQALAAIRDRGATLFIATSKPRVFAQRIVEHFGLDTWFTNVYGSELDGTRSNKTALLDFVLKDARLNASSTFMIGDRMHDMHGARDNGVTPIGALWGYGSRDELTSAGAAGLCDQPADVLALLLNLSCPSSLAGTL